MENACKINGLGVFTLCLAALFSSYSAVAGGNDCDGGQVTVSGPISETEFSRACDASTMALEFLSNAGLKTNIPVTINITPHPIESTGADVFGCYDPHDGLITVLKWDVCKPLFEKYRPFGQAATRPIYDSLIAHEVAHAVADANFTIDDPSEPAHEYIAYVVQIATMPKEIREKVLRDFPVSDRVSLETLHPVILWMSPDVFAVRAYTHYEYPDQGHQAFQAILSGDYLFPVPDDF